VQVLASTTYGRLSPAQLDELKKLKEVKEALDRLKRKGISADIPICPVCKSHRLVRLTSYYDLGYIGSFHPAYYCLECGWYGRTTIVMSNKPEKNEVLEDMIFAFSDLMEE
jgi:hypothetical protein